MTRGVLCRHGNRFPCGTCESEHFAAWSARRGAYWLGMLGFALAGPAATEHAARLADRYLFAVEGHTWGVDDVIRNGAW